jgi:signal peptidase I
MNFNFELILFYATLISGLLALFDIVFLAPRRHSAGRGNAPLPIISEYARSFFPVLLAVFLLRSFLYEPFRIPTGSLQPTVLIGDFIMVNKFAYGLRLPVIHTKLHAIGEPKRGDVIVFRYPPNPSIYYIKRVIGLPGDHITYTDKVLYVNDKIAPQTFVKNTQDFDENGNSWGVVQKEENFFGIKHAIYQIPGRANDNFRDEIVPPGMYFAMGDNRDDSADSRYWGFVPEKNIVGRADLIWMSWNSLADWAHKIRWQRIGTLLP